MHVNSEEMHGCMCVHEENSGELLGACSEILWTQHKSPFLSHLKCLSWTVYRTTFTWQSLVSLYLSLSVLFTHSCLARLNEILPQQHLYDISYILQKTSNGSAMCHYTSVYWKECRLPFPIKKKKKKCRL